ncbi:hypothetical protein RI129_013278 [Pyrocoelia pectoralis]|uniref:CRAL-TRIO domain-containing protein n=1 Tax=Pyrocoelia pectoralis TaxID=417401 RepID=A0AAN7V1L0_9COLE
MVQVHLITNKYKVNCVRYVLSFTNIIKTSFEHIELRMSRLEILKYTTDDRKHILEKYEKTVEDLPEDVNTIREWIKNQPHLPEILEDDVIERFMLLNKFRIEVTKQKIDAYYSLRSIIPEFYDKNPNGELIRDITNIVHFVPLPKLTEEYHRVVVIKPRDITSDAFDAVTYIAHTINFAEIRLRHDYYFKEVHIYDLGGVRIGNLAKFTPSVIKRAVLLLDKVFSNVVGGLHFINVPNFIDTFMVLLKSTLKPKMANMVFVHKGAESLYEMFSKEVLPKDYGGNERSLNELSDEWKKVFNNYDDLFQKLSKMKVNEELRQKPLFDEDDLFGIQGNFKKLNVD